MGQVIGRLSLTYFALVGLDSNGNGASHGYSNIKVAPLFWRKKDESC